MPEIGVSIKKTVRTISKERTLIEINFPEILGKMLGVLGLTNAFSKIFRVVYVVREASLPKKKICPKTRLFLW